MVPTARTHSTTKFANRSETFEPHILYRCSAVATECAQLLWHVALDDVVLKFSGSKTRWVISTWNQLHYTARSIVNVAFHHARSIIIVYNLHLALSIAIYCVIVINLLHNAHSSLLSNKHLTIVFMRCFICILGCPEVGIFVNIFLVLWNIYGETSCSFHIKLLFHALRSGKRTMSIRIRWHTFSAETRLLFRRSTIFCLTSKIAFHSRLWR